jgi:TPR repeat protein
MMSVLASLAATLLLSLPISALPVVTATQVQAAEGIKYPRVKREVFFPRPDGKRDQLQHLLYLAESPNTAPKRGRGYRILGDTLQKVGRIEEAMRAYEAGALQGDGPSTTIIMRAHAEGTYQPLYLNELLPLAYVPRAQELGTSGPMLMAELTAAGRIEGFGTEAEWLALAASRGSSAAILKLAEAAERDGDIKSALQLYASADSSMSKLDRALRQARVYYLGRDTKPNSKLALKWLAYAADLDSAATAQVAAGLYKKDAGTEEARAKLLDIALAGGIDPQGSGGYVSRLRTAKTDDERKALLPEIKTAADNGNASAALALAQDQLALADPALEDDAYHYLELAVAAGLEPAVTDAAGRLVGLPVGSPRAEALLTAMKSAADSGVVPAMLALADLYAWGGPVAADQALSLKYVQAAADAGHIESQLKLGLHFAQASADPEQAERARHYLEAAAKQGSAPAEAYLASLKPAV